MKQASCLISSGRLGRRAAVSQCCRLHNQRYVHWGANVVTVSDMMAPSVHFMGRSTKIWHEEKVMKARGHIVA